MFFLFNGVFNSFFFQIVSRGRILSYDTTDWFSGIIKSWYVRVTPQMSPSARLIGYYIDNNGQIAADSILLKVEDSLPTKVMIYDTVHSCIDCGLSFPFWEKYDNQGIIFK